MNDNRFVILSTSYITSKREAVISVRPDGGFAVAQRIMVEDDYDTIPYFLSGSMRISDREKLVSLRDALTRAIEEFDDINSGGAASRSSDPESVKGQGWED